MAATQRGPTGAWLIAMITIVNATCNAWFGYDTGVFASVLISSDFLAHFPQTNDANVSGITSSCFLLGAFFGAVAASLIGDRLGRKLTLLIGILLNTVGAVLQVAGFQLAQMIIGRLINGAGIGMTSSTSPVLVSECVPSRLRGKLVSAGVAFNVAGFALSNWINFGMYFRSGALQWRFPLAVQLILLFIVLPLLVIVPESPRWLLLVEREEQAKEVIARIEGNGVAVDDARVLAEFRSIQGAIRLEKKARVGTRDVLMCRDKTQNLRRVLLASGSQFMQQFSCINALGFYLPTLLQDSVGFDQEMSRLMTAVCGTIYMLANFLALPAIDRFGRRKLMLLGSLTIGADLLVAALCMKAGTDDPDKKQVMGRVVTAMFCLYYVFFGTTYCPAPWVYSSEINSIGWRSRGAATSVATNWMSGFVVVQFTKVGVDNLGWGFYLLFSIIVLAFFPIVYCFFPETSSRTLEDMDQMFLRHPGVFVLGKSELTQIERPRALIEAEMERIAASESSTTVEVLDRIQVVGKTA